MTELDLFAHYTARRRISSDGSTPEELTFVLGDQYSCKLHTFRDDVTGLTEVWPKVRSLKAKVGETMEPPTGGTFTLTRGDLTVEQFEETAEINFDSTAAQVMTIWNALGPLYETILEAVDGAPSTWLFRIDAVGKIPMKVSRNKLRPQAFVRVRAYREGDVWWHEVRLIKAAVCFTAGSTRVLAPPPSVVRIRTGSIRAPGSSSDTNEVQSIFFPIEFVGTYYVRWDYRTTKILGLSDDADALAVALNKMFGDAQTRFVVTNPEQGKLYVEFVGLLAETAQPLMEIVPVTFQPGPLTFTLNFRKAVAAAALRNTPAIVVPFEIELTVVNDDQDPTDVTIPGRTFTLFQEAKVNVVREGITEEMDEYVDVEWSRPPQPESYARITSDQVIVGHLHFEMAFGDPTALDFVFDHDLNTQAGLVGVRTNNSTGRVLGQGTEYTVEQALNSITISLIDFVSTDSLVLIFVAIENTPSFAPHHHAISDVDGLALVLETYGSQISEALDRLGYTVQTVTQLDSTLDLDIVIPSKSEAYPGKFATKQSVGAAPAAPIRPKALLPALHKAAVTELDFSGAVPTLSDATGKVYRHTGTAAVQLIGPSGHESPLIVTDDLVGCDGRGWYRVVNQAGSTSYYATSMQRLLFTIPINEDMLTPGHYCDLSFDFATQLLAANAVCQCLLKIDVGVPTSEGSPSPTGFNIKSTTWNVTPIVNRVIQLTELFVDGKFGANLRRAIDNSFVAVGRTYGTARGVSGAVPSAPNFFLRGMIHEFDVVDDVKDPRGAFYYALTNGAANFR